jgi:succinate dehydrogenase/fumarate reductase flavoprotein subunit
MSKLSESTWREKFLELEREHNKTLAEKRKVERRNRSLEKQLARMETVWAESNLGLYVKPKHRRVS